MVSHIRKEGYNNLKERYPKYSSIFHNPYKVGRDGTREELVKKI